MSSLDLLELEPSRQSNDYNLLPLRIYSQAYSDHLFFISHHWHEEIEIIYIESGEFLIHINWNPYTAKAGEVFFINSAEVHQITATTENSIHYAILFNPKILKFEWHDPLGQKPLLSLINQRLKFLPHVNDQTELNSQIIKEIKHIIAVEENNKPSRTMMIKSALLEIFSLLIDHESVVKEEIILKKDRDKAKLARKIMTYVNDFYSQKLSIEKIANELNLSPSHFSKVFKTIFEQTFVEYLTNVRIEKACIFLGQTDMFIIDISLNVGFDNFSYFIKKFKKIKGMTPGAYRQSIQSL